MRKCLKKLFFFSVMLILVSGLIGCKKDEEPKEEVKQEEVQDVVEDIPEENIEEQVEEEPEPVVLTDENLLTGLKDLTDEAIGMRPVAVMVNNVNAALPQYGIEAADVIFEMHVEGNLTRMMALYADYTQVPKVCAVRSCRYYYPVISEGFDAIYAHWGMDETMRSYVEAIDSTRFDAMVNDCGLFGRDQNRINSGYSLEHTAYFDGTKLPKVMSDLKERTELLENKKQTAFLFHETEEQVKPEGETCNVVKVDFGAATAKFTYDEESKTYFKQINGKDQMDSVAKKQISFTNVFILETSVKPRTQYDHKEIDWQGGKDAVGYYISNGVVQKINWSKSSEKDYLKFFNENGEELAINRGKSYIAFNYANQTVFE